GSTPWHVDTERRSGTGWFTDETGLLGGRGYGSGCRYGGAVPVARGQGEPNVFDEWVEEPRPIVRVAQGARADVHECQRAEEVRDLDQRIRNRDRHAEHRAVAAAVACPRREQLGRQQDETEDHEDQRRHRRDDQDLAELRR